MHFHNLEIVFGESAVPRRSEARWGQSSAGRYLLTVLFILWDLNWPRGGFAGAYSQEALSQHSLLESRGFTCPVLLLAGRTLVWSLDLLRSWRVFLILEGLSSQCPVCAVVLFPVLYPSHEHVGNFPQICPRGNTCSKAVSRLTRIWAVLSAPQGGDVKMMQYTGAMTDLLSHLPRSIALGSSKITCMLLRKIWHKLAFGQCLLLKCLFAVFYPNGRLWFC